MITRTENGYALGDWEGVPMRLPNGRKLSPGEIRAALCRVNGMKSPEASEELHCSKNNVYQLWKSIYFKTHCDDVVIAINKLIDTGALHRLNALFMVLLVAYSAIDDSPEMLRPRQGSRQTVRQMRTRYDDLAVIRGAA